MAPCSFERTLFQKKKSGTKGGKDNLRLKSCKGNPLCGGTTTSQVFWCRDKTGICNEFGTKKKQCLMFGQLKSYFSRITNVACGVRRSKSGHDLKQLIVFDYGTLPERYQRCGPER